MSIRSFLSKWRSGTSWTPGETSGRRSEESGDRRPRPGSRGLVGSARALSPLSPVRARVGRLPGRSASTSEEADDGSLLRPDGELYIRIERFPVPGLTWPTYYVGVALVGISVIAKQLLDPRATSRPELAPIVVGIFLLLSMSALYQQWSCIEVPAGDDRNPE